MSNENVTAKAKSAVCSNCGGQLNIDGLQDTVECPYCGTSFPISELIDESDAVRVEKIKQKTYKDIELEKLEHEKEKNKKQEDKDKVQSFKKSKFSKVLIIFAVLSLLFCAVAFNDGKILAGIVALIQVALFTGSWLMGMQIVNEPRKGIRALAAVLAFVLIIPYFGLYNSNSKRVEKINWDDIVLGEMLPKPPANKGEIHNNSSEDLWISIENISDKQYNDYVEACKGNGFTVDIDANSSSYEAYNDDGYKLDLSHYGSDSDMTIKLEAPMQMTTVQWPTSTAGSKLPTPKSTKGKFSYEHDDNFFVYLGDTSKADYDAYVNSCAEKGFNVDFDKGDDYYYADNNEGWHISLRYEGNNIMSVNIDAPDEDESTDTSTSTETPTETEEQEETSSESSTTSTDIGDDFKAAMDSYEKFFDEYVAIMKKYANNPNDMSILGDYAKYMGKYAQMMEDFEKWESEDMNAAETAYYLEVQGRITKKLLEVAQ